MIDELSGGNRFLVIGCGDLGSRCAQTISKLGSKIELTLVDPSPKSLTLAEHRVMESGFAGTLLQKNDAS